MAKIPDIGTLRGNLSPGGGGGGGGGRGGRDGGGFGLDAETDPCMATRPHKTCSR